MQKQKRNFHLPLPEDLYQMLRVEAERRKRPATEIVREVLEEWQKRLRAETLHAEIADYASKHAGTTADLDPLLEAAGIETLTHDRVKSRRRKKGKTR